MLQHECRKIPITHIMLVSVQCRIHVLKVFFKLSANLQSGTGKDLSETLKSCCQFKNIKSSSTGSGQRLPLPCSWLLANLLNPGNITLPECLHHIDLYTILCNNRIICTIFYLFQWHIHALCFCCNFLFPIPVPVQRSTWGNQAILIQ